MTTPAIASSVGFKGTSAGASAWVDNLYKVNGDVWDFGAGLSLGETSSDAYRGDRGKIAYDHSLVTGSNPHATTYASLVGIPSTFTPSAHTHPQSDITNLVSDLAGKQATITTGTTAQYLRGDLSLATLNQAAVAGLTTSDSPTFANLISSGYLMLGGSSGPRLKNSSGAIAARNNADSADAGLSGSTGTFSGNLSASAGVFYSDLTMGQNSSAPELNLNLNYVRLKGQSDGVMSLWDTARTSFNRLQFGGTTSSYPALKRSGTTLAARLADDSADAPFTASTGTFSGNITLSKVAGSGGHTGGIVAEVIADPSNAAEPALRIYPNRDSTRLHLGKSGNTFYSISFGNVQTLESVPAFETPDNFKYGYTAGASHNIGRSSDNVVYSSSSPSGGAHVWRTSTSYGASFIEAMRLSVAGALTVASSVTSIPTGSSVTLSVNGQLTIETTSNTAGNIVYRGSDGVTRRSAITFS